MRYSGASGPYRIDCLAQYLDVSARHAETGAKLDYLHIRQERVDSIEYASVVSFNWVSRSSLDGLATSSLGYGTAIIVKDQITHLHITRYAPSLGGSSAAGGGTRAQTEFGSLNQLLWADSPEPSPSVI